eukprot:3425064-Amphidinium_carterae.2
MELSKKLGASHPGPGGEPQASVSELRFDTINLQGFSNLGEILTKARRYPHPRDLYPRVAQG